MKRKSSVFIVLGAMVAFGLLTFFFYSGLRVATANQREVMDRGNDLVYTRPAQPEQSITEPIQTEPETLPPETEPVQTEPEVLRTVYEQVPRFDQTAYAGILYRSGTVATSGSNITSLAMVASYLTGHEYTPDYLADSFANFIGNSMEWLEYASDQLQLPWERAANIDVTIQALREGKIAIALMNERSLFMDGQHFVVFTGVTEDGKILVNDPYGPNYESWNLKNALENGFARTDLTGGYSGGWIYDPAAVPEVPFLYEAPVNADAFRYGDMTLSQEDVELIARLVCAEGESEPFEGQQGIAEVILNRMAADNFPDTAKGVVYAEGQFLAANSLYLHTPTHTQYEAVDRALNGPYILEGDVVFFSQYAVNDNVYATIGKHVFCRQW